MQKQLVFAPASLILTNYYLTAIVALCIFLWNGFMNHNQKVAFWSIFIMFCVGATASIYPQGAFNNITLGGSIIMAVFYLIVAIFIRKFVKSNPKDIDKWFQK